jgi:NAD(P)-dependent dehydrogenase (short-subunit alcohol dehydrogenase family)
MKNRLEGRRILITGAASGIGAATAELFAAEGAELVLLDSDEERIAVKAKALSAHAICADVTDPAAVQAAVDQAVDRMAGLDGLVNGAGILHVLPFDRTTLADWEKVIRVNLTGPWIVCQAALKPLRAASGATIVNIATGLALRPTANYSSYIASKSGLLALTKSLAIELAPAVRVNAVCPGAVETPMTAELYRDEIRRSEAASNYALKRLGTPSEVAEAVLFLTGRESGFITGVSLAVDGGRSFH